MVATLEEASGVKDSEYEYVTEEPTHALHIIGRREIRLALDAQRFYGALNCLAGQLRQWDKYGMDEKSVRSAVEKIRKEFYSVLDEYNVNLDAYGLDD